MAGFDDPTVPPPPRRPARKDSPAPDLTSDPSRELVLLKLREVEERAKDTTQRAIAEVVEVFERQIEERDDRIEELEATIRALQRADTAALRSQAELQAAMTASIASAVTTEVTKQLDQRVQAQATITSNEATDRRGARWTVIAGAVGTAVAAAVSYGYRDCSTEKSPVPTTITQPVKGPGYGGRP